MTNFVFRFNLEKSFMKDSKSSLQEADIIGVIHDASNVWTRHKLDLKVIRLLEDHKNKSSFLVFNKVSNVTSLFTMFNIFLQVDIIRSKRKLLDLTRIVTENCINGKPIPGTKPLKNKDTKGWPHFQDIFMTSALTGDGLAQVKNYLIKNAKPDHWLFPAEIWSDQTAEEIITKSVKAKLLDFLPQEIPYTLKPELEFFNVNEKGIHIVVYDAILIRFS